MRIGIIFLILCQRQKGCSHHLKKFFGIFFMLLFSGVIAFLVSVVMLDGATSQNDGATLVAEADMPTNADIAAKLSNSVVGVSSVSQSRSLTAPAQTNSMGSGVIVSEDGYILTNHHVVGDKTKIFVTLSDGQTVSAHKIWSDDALDIAIILAEADHLTAAPLGDSAAVNVGDPVLAIGNPLSLQFQRTVTAGIISAKNRMLRLSENNVLMEDLLQTDASINPGNSGGPLINMKGEVIGINTIKAQDAEGMGFAIAINLCKPIVERTVSEGMYKMPYLGLYAFDRATALYMEGDYPEGDGLYVTDVATKSPALLAGVRSGDMITAFEGEPLTSMAHLREKLLYYRPDDTVHLEINRRGTRFTATVTLKEYK